MSDALSLSFRASAVMFRTASNHLGSWLELLACGALMAADLQANPLTHPTRVINGQTADLQPLFRWYAKPQGPRPLSAWVHLTGELIGTNSWGWIVNARIFDAVSLTGHTGSPIQAPSHIILKDPPRQDQAQFEQLNAQVQHLKNQKASLSAEVASARKTAQNNARQQQAAHIRSLALAQENKQLNQVAKRDSAALKSIDQQLQRLTRQMSLYCTADHYTVDCVALDLKLTHQGLPVFDYGSVPQ